MSEFITLAEAVTMIKTYKDNKDVMLEPDYRNKDIMLTCETFDKTDIEELLSQDDCVKMRVYLGMDENLLIRTIIVGVNSKDQDILTPGDELILDRAFRCPTVCPPESALIS